MSLLSPYRVIDLADERGLICGEILGDLGADVIAVEPPEGNPARRAGPFTASDDGPLSLHWLAYARNKRSAAIDLRTGDGRAQLHRLVQAADFFIESSDPGVMASMGLGYSELARLNPRLVYVSITPFGQTGPKVGYAATDLTLMAASGPMALMRDEQLPPLRMGVPQAFLHGGAEAAAASLIAHYERQRSGLGQHVDVSIQQALTCATLSRILDEPVGDGEQLDQPRVGSSFVCPAADGYVSITFYFDNTIGPFSARLVEWMCEEGACDPHLRARDWVGYGERVLAGEESMAGYEDLLDKIRRFVAAKPRDALLAAAQERRLLIAPIATIADLGKSPQLEARDFWRDVHIPALRHSVTTPGPFAKLSGTPIQYRHPAPRLGEHTSEVLGESPAPPLHSTLPSQASGLALRDLKVLDFSWVVAGPAITRVLADYGATVVKVESSTSLDLAREFAPFHDGIPGIERSAMFHNMAAGKMSLTLNLATLEARHVVEDLVGWADVVCESFSPRAMRRWGLDYPSLRKINPRVVMLSSCLFGQDGPYATFAGFGTMGAALAGFNSVIGWPDRAPIGQIMAYTDTVSPRFGLAALLAALDHRDRTGNGQYVDLSQMEASLHFLTPAWLDFAINGKDFVRHGNTDPQMCPHAVLQAAGEDAWVAIACRTDRDWAALVDVVGIPELRRDSWNSLANRLACREELEHLLACWTRCHTPAGVEELLQERGIPAHAIQGSADLFTDSQLRLRQHFIELSHDSVGKVIIEAPRVKLSRTPAEVTRPGPQLGEHNFLILSDILQYDDERIAELVSTGAVG